jgi:hypothetical protein
MSIAQNIINAQTSLEYHQGRLHGLTDEAERKLCSDLITYYTNDVETLRGIVARVERQNELFRMARAPVPPPRLRTFEIVCIPLYIVNTIWTGILLGGAGLAFVIGVVLLVGGVIYGNFF